MINQQSGFIKILMVYFYYFPSPEFQVVRLQALCYIDRGNILKIHLITVSRMSMSAGAEQSFPLFGFEFRTVLDLIIETFAKPCTMVKRYLVIS